MPDGGAMAPCRHVGRRPQYSPFRLPPHRIDPCKFAISAAPACAFPPSVSAATISAGASTWRRRARSIHKAIDLGVTLFDTADIYADMGGSETVLGEVLGDRRKDIVLATKFSKPMATTAPSRARRAATSCRRWRRA